tara:strand:- start:1268 stop:1759 length:492 start_codon:yes stop_codon:yes gene_type:complete
MALQGNLIIYGIKEEGTVTREITLPKSLPDNHEYKEQEGQTIEVEEPNFVKYEKHNIENAYVIVRMAAIHVDDYDRYTEDADGNSYEIDVPRGDTKQGYNLNLRYNIYSSQDARQDYFLKPDLEIDIPEQIRLENLDFNGKNLIEYCYEYLKTKEGFENLKDI